MWTDKIFGPFTFRTALICKNGHMLTSSIEDEPFAVHKFCSICGATTISACSECNAAIVGSRYYERNDITEMSSKVPAYCCDCGKPYPWTRTALETATALIQEDDGINDVQCKELVASLPDIITETPKTNVAVVRLKKALLTMGKFTAEGLRQFAIDFGCELAKSQLGL